MESGLGSLLPKRGQKDRRLSEGSIPLLYTALPLATVVEQEWGMHAPLEDGDEGFNPLRCFDMSTTGKRTSSEGTKDDKTKSKKSKKKLLPFLRRRLSEGNLFVKSSSFPKFSAEEKKLQPENKDAARAAENSCSGGELQICAVTTQVEDPAGGTAVTSETQEKPTKITSETDPAVRSPAGGEPRTSKGASLQTEGRPPGGDSLQTKEHRQKGASHLSGDRVQREASPQATECHLLKGASLRTEDHPQPAGRVPKQGTISPKGPFSAQRSVSQEEFLPKQ
ncbi:Hypp8141 [Branchiostoma lanceolatum]|uniref:Hypp8141 protein n=1 Tax=Branchiostoma lanceolatum TaxID=7740 RepID=A0A8J9Z7S8_BRALA|nr:Hypp8141 [Branchiostoma lanceolatum]